jgi:uncharacterized protein YegP (UPF0339 family)
MAGTFELFHDGGASFRFRLKAPDGTVVAVSRQFSDKGAAVEGIHAVRECAGTGLITDLCPPTPPGAVKEQDPLYIRAGHAGSDQRHRRNKANSKFKEHI